MFGVGAGGWGVQHFEEPAASVREAEDGVKAGGIKEGLVRDGSLAV
jgi:hypothetical protein